MWSKRWKFRLKCDFKGTEGETCGLQYDFFKRIEGNAWIAYNFVKKMVESWWLRSNSCWEMAVISRLMAMFSNIMGVNFKVATHYQNSKHCKKWHFSSSFKQMSFHKPHYCFLLQIYIISFLLLFHLIFTILKAPKLKW